MPSFDRAEISEQAREYGFLRDTYEKVFRLTRILAYFQSDDMLRKHLILKGGTAINLTIFELPRLSVDIDLDYTPNDSKEETQENRSKINLIIRDYMEEAGYRLSEQSRFSHSLDAFHYQYQNSSGNTDMIKIELNYSLRAHLFERTQRKLQTDAFGGDIMVQTLDPIEIFAAKTNALLTRAAARDLYDFCNMISKNMFVGQEDIFRKSIVFYATISSNHLDEYFDTEAISRISFSQIKRELFPVLSSQESHAYFDLDAHKKMAKAYIQHLMTLTDKEKEYIARFKRREYKPDLLFSDEAILDRIESHPMALWKCRQL